MKTVYVKLKEDEAALMIDGTPVEFMELKRAMADLEGMLEAQGDAGALAAFRAIGEMVARARVVSCEPLDPDRSGERRNSHGSENNGPQRHFGNTRQGEFDA